MSMSLDQWKEWAAADAERRGLPALRPLLEGLAAATARLRATEWQTAADRSAGSVSERAHGER